MLNLTCSKLKVAAVAFCWFSCWSSGAFAEASNDDSAWCQTCMEMVGIVEQDVAHAYPDDKVYRTKVITEP